MGSIQCKRFSIQAACASSFTMFNSLSCSVGSENQAEIVEESIKHAKEAITLDVKDGNAWCKNNLFIHVLTYESCTIL